MRNMERIIQITEAEYKELSETANMNEKQIKEEIQKLSKEHPKLLLKLEIEVDDNGRTKMPICTECEVNSLLPIQENEIKLAEKANEVFRFFLADKLEDLRGRIELLKRERLYFAILSLICFLGFLYGIFIK